MKARSRTALTVLVAALALMLAAGTGATASLMISGKQIKDNSVTSQDIKNKSLKVKDLSRKAQVKLKGRTGATGATGATGPAGPAGATGASGLSGFKVEQFTTTIPAFNIIGGTASVPGVCPAGKKAISATASYASAPLAQLDSLVSQVTRTAENSFSASGLNLSLTDRVLTLDVVCATVAD